MSRDGRECADTDGQSEVVGVILLAAVVVLLMGVFGAFNLHVLVRVDGSRQRFPIDSANVAGDGDDEFAPLNDSPGITPWVVAMWKYSCSTHPPTRFSSGRTWPSAPGNPSWMNSAAANSIRRTT